VVSLNGPYGAKLHGSSQSRRGVSGGGEVRPWSSAGADAGVSGSSAAPTDGSVSLVLMVDGDETAELDAAALAERCHGGVPAAGAAAVRRSRVLT